MKILLSTKYSAGTVSAAMLFLRLISGILMMNIGYQKLIHFSEMKGGFMNFMGIGSTASLSFVIFAEFFCSIFIILGLFTRFAAVPLIFVMCVVIFKSDNGDVLGDAQLPTMYLAAFLTILLLGPGRVSVDSMISK